MQVTLDVPPQMVATACWHAMHGHGDWQSCLEDWDYWRQKEDERAWPSPLTPDWFREQAVSLRSAGCRFQPFSVLTPEQNEKMRAGCARAFREASEMMEQALAAWEASQLASHEAGQVSHNAEGGAG